jgi:arylsulfatase A-like enzyme
VLFSSDNGPHQEGGHKVDFFDSNGPLRGWKRDLYEGGIRVPLLAWWPGTTPAGRTTDHVSAFQDMFPTLLDLAGVEEIPDTDGISMAATLRGQMEAQARHDHLYWEFYEQGGKTAVVKQQWKAVRLDVLKDPQAPIELYDLSNDIGETNNVAGQHPDLVAEMGRIMRAEHRESE